MSEPTPAPQLATDKRGVTIERISDTVTRVTVPCRVAARIAEVERDYAKIDKTRDGSASDWFMSGQLQGLREALMLREELVRENARLREGIETALRRLKHIDLAWAVEAAIGVLTQAIEPNHLL